MNNKEWIGVDLDGTLAYYDGWKGADHIGMPIRKMIERVRNWLAEGKNIRIVTARVSPVNGQEAHVAYRAIVNWLRVHIGQELPVTHEKDHMISEIWDDRAVQVVKNTGERVDGKE
jgi:hypothetical protein